MTRMRFLLVWCWVLAASACLTNAAQCAATYGQCGDAKGTGCCSQCGAVVCSCEESECLPQYLFPQKDGGFNVRGWVDAGFIGNMSDPDSRFNGPYNAVDRSNEPMLNQFYVIGERLLPQCGLGVGGRIDMMYGEDFFLAQSAGFELYRSGQQRWNPEYYGLAIPQAYVDLGSQDASLQIGHFYSIMGYEGLMAPSNFFYSRAYSYQFAGPFQHWGGQFNYNLNDSWSVHLGLVNGWNALDRESDDLSVIGKIKYENDCTGVWTSLAVITGKEYTSPSQIMRRNNDYENRTRYSWLVGLPLTCRTEYVFHHWLGAQQDGTVTGSTAYWYGVDQYLYYTINNCWKAGLRFEWFRDEDGTRVGLNRASNPNNPPYPGDFYSLSLGVNWTPTTNLMVRPEIRSDWYDGDAARLPFDDGTDSSQLMLGFDAILLF
jgi:hypothetical protein